MILPAVCGRISAVLRRFAGNTRGMSAVEFALIAPLMVTLYLGTVEISQGVGAQRKVTLTARTVADLASQSQQITSAQMNDLLHASTAVLTPYSASNAGVRVSEVSVDGQGRATITWSQALNANLAARTAGQSVTLPAALDVPNTSLVWSEVQYAYTPIFHYIITGTLNLHDQMYMRPRIGDTVAMTP